MPLLFVSAAALAGPSLRASCRAAARWVQALLSIPWTPPLLTFAVAFGFASVRTVVNLSAQPAVHDEFSNLLATDTFLHARLTNPTPPGWQNLEAFHETVRPTFMSKYPPGQGLMLAAGKLLHLPDAGIFFVVALACATTCWLAQAWLPPAWALLAGLLAAVSLSSLYWGSNYLGGGPPMLVGALLGGAISRLMRRRTGCHPARQGLIIGASLGLLANTRPLEGLILAAILAACLAVAAFHHPWIRRRLPRAALGAAAVLLPIFAWIAYDNWRVTGDARTLPYIAAAHQYQTVPLFRGQPLRPAPAYLTDRLSALYVGVEQQQFQLEQTSAGIATATARKLDYMAALWLSPPTLLLPAAAALCAILAAAPAGRRAHKRRVFARAIALPIAVVVLLPAIEMAVTPWMRLHYLAPAAPFWPLLLAMGMRATTAAASRAPRLTAAAAASFAPAVLAVQMIMAVTYVNNVLLNGSPDFAAQRANLVASILQSPGAHIAMITYRPGASVYDDLVFNDADIATSPLIFARAIDPQTDAHFQAMYPGRTVWQIQVSPDPIQPSAIRIARMAPASPSR